MRRAGAAPLLLLLLSLTANSQNASEATSPAIPSYRVFFKRGEAASGSGGWVSLRLPFECTSDGTIFVDFLTKPTNPTIEDPVFPATTLVSISPGGHAQTFHLDEAPKLYSANESFYATDSGVMFLVSGTLEKKLVTGTSTRADGSQYEFTRNDAERHLYILNFARDGTYRRSTEIEPPFRVERLGVFESGTLLVYGSSHRLALLKTDGTLLKELQVPADDPPDQASGKDRPSRAAQLIPYGRSLLVLQNGKFPLLEVSEGGEIRVVHTKLPKGQYIESLIPSDQGLYVILSADSQDGTKSMAVYEINPGDGTLLRHFELGDRRALSMACVHDQKFLSIDYSDGRIVPLVGSADPKPTADQPGDDLPPGKLN